MEILISIIAKISEYTVKPVVRELGYVCFIDRNFQKLKNQVEKLKDTRASVQDMVCNARRNAQDIKSVVEKWLREVDGIIGKSEAILLVNEGQHVRLCPNLVQRHKLSRKASKLADEVIEMKNEGNFDQVSCKVVVSLPESSVPKISDFLNFESRKLVMNQIMDALLDDDVNKVGVYGMGGVGKTMLVQEILRKIMEKKSFDEVVISAISQTPDLKRIQGQLADKLGLNFQQETIEGRALMLQKRLKMEKSILIVLDDVWEYIDLETIGIPSVVDHKGCKILFTSRDKHLLSNEMWINKFFEIEVIQKVESWDLFKTMVGEIVEDLKPIANQIVTECARLPIAITTVAKALRNKRYPIWKDALDQLKNPMVVNIRGMDKQVYSSLKLSYNYLEGEEVKLVFLLCSMFPEDFDINVKKLQVYAMGMGFLHGVDTVAQGRRRITKLVDDLISSSLLLRSESSDNYVKMHDLVRDVAILIALKNEQIRTLSYVKRLNEELDEEKLSGNHTAAYLDLRGSHSLPKKLMLPNLQILRLHGSGLVGHKLAETFFEEMKELKCLEFKKVEISLLPSSLYNSFANIRLLRLIDCKLGSIDMIGELNQLEILSFKKSDIIELPTSVSQLTQLKVLDLSSCEYLKVVRPNILSKLTKLEELYLETFDGWEREDGGRKNASISEIRDLSHLYALNLNIQDEKTMPKQLFSRELDLEKFQITMGRKKINVKKGISRMLCLKMESECCLDDWIKMLLKRTEELWLVGLIGTKILHSELDKNDFSHLKHLSLCDNLELQHLIHEQNKPFHKILSNLEYLEIDNLENLESIIHGYVTESPFNKLRTVTIRHCNKLETLFFNCILDDLLNLEEINIFDCKNMNVITLMENEEATNQIEFPHLKSLRLHGLPQLQNFCSKMKKVEQLSLHNSEKAETSTLSRNGRSFFSEQVSLPNLEELCIDGADSLKIIWHYNILIPNSFSKLNTVWIYSCNSLEKAFPSNILSMLTCLNSICISHCSSLEGIFEEVQELNATEKYLAVIRNLRKLELFNLPKLEYVWSRDPGELQIFENVEYFSIDECPKLKRAYSVKLLKQLGHLTIDFGELLEVVEREKSSVQMFESKQFEMFESKQFETSNKAKSTQIQDGPGRLFPKLKSLTLTGSLDYKLTHELPMEVVGILHNLKEFEVRRTFFEEIFPNVEEYQNATSMPLRWITISELPKLRHLWKENSSLENLRNLGISRCSRLNILFPSSMSFRSLCVLEVIECHRLTHLLVPSIARTLVQLRCLTLRRCKGMITVIAEGAEEGNDEIVFNKLETLVIVNFSKLTNFYSGKCIIKFPRLTKVRVTNCPEMKTFSLGVVSTPLLSTREIVSFENGRRSPALKNHSEEEISVKDINVIFRQIWEDNYDTDVKYLFAEENFDQANQSDPSSSSSHC